MSDKPRFPNATGMRVAAELCRALKPACERLVVAGSLRRRRPTIGDVEILYISRTETRPDPADLFRNVQVILVDEVIATLENAGVLERRTNTKGSEMFGEKNKLMRHRATGLPVDLFATSEASWWNYLVCRTGPAESNTRIATLAREKGYQWGPYSPGFTHLGNGRITRMKSEEAVFQFVGIPYLPPDQR